MSEQTTNESIYHALRPLDPNGGLDILLRSCPHLTKLTLKRTYLSYLTLERVVDGVNHSTITDLDLAECHLDLVHAPLVARLLKKNKLQHFSVRYNRLGQRGSIHISKSLAHAVNLRSFDIGWNDIGFEGAQAILDAVTWGLELNIDCNTIPRLSYLQIKTRLTSLQEQYTCGQPSSRKKDTETQEKELKTALRGRTLCAALGGDQVISKVIDRFYIYVVTDPSLSKYFRNISMGRMRHLQSSYIAHMFGSTKPYKGRDIAEGHQHLGITHDHFEQASYWFIQSIRDVCPHVPHVVMSQCIELINNLRPAIVTCDPHKEPSLIGVLNDDESTDSSQASSSS